jgi:hypothetical protein
MIEPFSFADRPLSRGPALDHHPDLTRTAFERDLDDRPLDGERGINRESGSGHQPSPALGVALPA